MLLWRVISALPVLACVCACTAPTLPESVDSIAFRMFRSKQAIKQSWTNDEGRLWDAARVDLHVCAGHLKSLDNCFQFARHLRAMLELYSGRAQGDHEHDSLIYTDYITVHHLPSDMAAAGAFRFSTFDVTRQVFYASKLSYGIVNLKPIVDNRQSDQATRTTQ